MLPFASASGQRSGNASGATTAGKQGNHAFDSQLGASGGLDNVLSNSQLDKKNMQPAMKGVLDYLINEFIHDNDQGHLAIKE